MTGRNWYEESREAVKAVYAGDWKLFCALLAATSANSQVKSNTTLARKAYNMIKETGTVRREGFIRTHYHSILHVLQFGHPRGRKCNAMYQNLIGNEEPVTVDIWMIRVAGLNKHQPSKFDYDLIEDNVKQEAHELGITPAQRQAELWSEIRGSSASYATALCQYRMF